MSLITLRAGLLTSLIDCINQYNTDNSKSVGMGFENKTFDPAGLESYVNMAIIPVTSEPAGKKDTDTNEDIGIFQVSVYVESNEYDIEQLTIIDYIRSYFKFNTVHGDVIITESTVNSGRTESSWFVRDISINYLTFQER